jgi:hypothetical protein
VFPYTKICFVINCLKRPKNKEITAFKVTVADNTTRGKKLPLNNSGTPNKKEPC